MNENIMMFINKNNNLINDGDFNFDTMKIKSLCEREKKILKQKISIKVSNKFISHHDILNKLQKVHNNIKYYLRVKKIKKQKQSPIKKKIIKK